MKPFNKLIMTEKLRYSDEELEEFRALILEKLSAAQALYDELIETINNGSGNGTLDTSPTFKALEDASDVNEREANCRLAERQRKFIEHLRGALVRIDNKTYGVCRATGKLIPKERLRAVPHATLSVEAKLNRK